MSGLPAFMRIVAIGTYIADMVRGSIKYDGFWMIGSHLTSLLTFAVSWWLIGWFSRSLASLPPEGGIV